MRCVVDRQGGKFRELVEEGEQVGVVLRQNGIVVGVGFFDFYVGDFVFVDHVVELGR